MGREQGRLPSPPQQRVLTSLNADRGQTRRHFSPTTTTTTTSTTTTTNTKLPYLSITKAIHFYLSHL
ncbi:hypothetical protein E2C01_079826 [Portunus trituberculatus]|uniref:Uncharacterized protein n=1 Tax=Portunus trituberculatus TaxID=210409 RepID=A0A5B7IUC4_PORTR|nr:hypothetical protein [Portunus trituberculatus]